MFRTALLLVNQYETAGADNCITVEFNFVFDFTTRVAVKQERCFGSDCNERLCMESRCGSQNGVHNKLYWLLMTYKQKPIQFITCRMDFSG